MFPDRFRIQAEDFRPVGIQARFGCHFLGGLPVRSKPPPVKSDPDPVSDDALIRKKISSGSNFFLAAEKNTNINNLKRPKYAKNTNIRSGFKKKVRFFAEGEETDRKSVV